MDYSGPRPAHGHRRRGFVPEYDVDDPRPRSGPDSERNDARTGESGPAHIGLRWPVWFGNRFVDNRDVHRGRVQKPVCQEWQMKLMKYKMLLLFFAAAVLLYASVAYSHHSLAATYNSTA